MRGLRAWAACAAISAATASVVMLGGLAGVLGLSCDLGLDVDSLSRCPECADASDAAIPDVSIDGALLSDAGADIDAAEAAACTTGGRGPEMVAVVSGGSSFCIDRTEVTNDQFAAFLASGFRAESGDAGAPCAPDASYVPSSSWPPPAARGDHPVRDLTWCASRAFCIWAGKRLCGARGSKRALDVALIGQPELDEWTAACGAPDGRAFPYGTTYAPGACNGADKNILNTVPTGTLPGCAASEGAPRDLSGNVWEWIDACEANGRCYAHGGAYNSPAAELTCAMKIGAGSDASLATVGFRCCGL
jgi:sulfatase modifying factor 1